MKAMEPIAEFMMVTPQMAEKWLKENNIHNRKLYETTIDSYTRDMKNDAWGINNQGIGFDVNGTLLDGQQRLSAIVQVGKAVRLLVVTNLPVKQGKENIPTQETIDGGKVRTVGDRLTLSGGLDNANAKVAIANVIAMMVMGTTLRSSPDTARRIIDLYLDEMEFVLSGRSTVRDLSFSPAIAAFVFGAKVYLDDSVEFKERYFKGTECSAGHPALTLRDFMLNKKARGGFVNRGSGYRASVFNATLNAMEAHHKKKMLRKITASTHGFEYYFDRQTTCVGMVKGWLAL